VRPNRVKCRSSVETTTGSARRGSRPGRSSAEHIEASRRLRTSFLYLPLSPDIDQLILDIRAALWNAATGRAAGVIDVALAATAVHSAARVLHYDSDFDHIAAAYPQLDAAWVVPRGSID